MGSASDVFGKTIILPLNNEVGFRQAEPVKPFASNSDSEIFSRLLIDFTGFENHEERKWTNTFTNGKKTHKKHRTLIQRCASMIGIAVFQV